MNIGETSSISRLPNTWTKVSRKRKRCYLFSGKEVDFARSLLDKQHEFNGTSLEVNKIRQSFYLGRLAQQKFS